MTNEVRRGLRSDASIEPFSLDQVHVADFALANKSFDELLIESVDEALRGIFGGAIMKTVYFHLEQNYSIRRDQLPEKLDVFASSCEDVFGSGQETFEKTVAERLYSKLGWDFWEVPGFRLTDYVQRAKERLAREGVRQMGTSCLDGLTQI